MIMHKTFHHSVFLGRALDYPALLGNTFYGSVRSYRILKDSARTAEPQIALQDCLCFSEYPVTLLRII